MDRQQAIRYFNGLARGLGPDNLGAPVDAAAAALNLGLAGVGYAGHKTGLLKEPLGLIEKPVGGSDWIAEKLGNADDGSGAYTAGRLTPMAVGLARLGGRGAVKAVDKALTSGPAAHGKAAQRGAVKVALNRRELLGELEKLTGAKAPEAFDTAEAGIYFRNQMRKNGALGGELEQSRLTPEVQQVLSRLRATEISRNPKFLYHSTSPDRLESIRQAGLVPGAPARHEGLSQTGVYFAASPEGAKYFSQPGDILLRVPAKGGPTALEPDIFGGDGSFLSREGVLPELLELQQGGKWGKLR
jgi:hypothetical protein